MTQFSSTPPYTALPLAPPPPSVSPPPTYCSRDNTFAPDNPLGLPLLSRLVHISSGVRHKLEAVVEGGASRREAALSTVEKVRVKGGGGRGETESCGGLRYRLVRYCERVSLSGLCLQVLCVGVCNLVCCVPVLCPCVLCPCVLCAVHAVPRRLQVQSSRAPCGATTPTGPCSTQDCGGQTTATPCCCSCPAAHGHPPAATHPQ